MKCSVFIFLITIYLLLTTNIHAVHVLPYPSYMPGNKLYYVSRVLEKIQKVWHFGTIGKLTYYTHMSDKYLVTAKTLFEYKQYKLARSALDEADQYVEYIPIYIQKMVVEHKDHSQKQALLIDQMDEHIRVLMFLKTILPEEYVWEPEFDASETIRIHALLDDAILLREEIRGKMSEL